MISVDYSLVIQIVFFLFLYLVLRKVLFRPYLTLLEERERRTSGAKHESTNLFEEAEHLRAQYEEAIARAYEAGGSAKEAIVQAAREQREKLLTQARGEATNVLERVRQEVQSELKKEREPAAREADSVARDMAGKILGRTIG